MTKHKCVCCQNYTLDDEPPGTFEICPVCFWEDDNTQFNDPDYEGGSNKLSLRSARENYIKIGAISTEFLKHVRKPQDSEIS